MKKSSVTNGLFNKVCLLLFVVAVCLVILSSLLRRFDHDEFEAIHSVWKVYQGERLYVDAFQHHHPFYYYLLTPVLAVLGEGTASIYAMRITSLVMTALIVIVSCRLSLEIYNDKRIAILTVILLSASFVFIEKAIEIRPDVPQTLFGLVSIWAMLGYLANKRRLFLILSAVSLAVSFLFLQKSLFPGGLLVLLLCINVYKKQIRFRDLLLYCIVAIAVIIPYYVYLLWSDTFVAYWTFNWLLNMRFMQHFSAVNSIGYALRTGTFLCVFYFWGLLKFTKTDSQIRLGWLSLGLTGSMFLVRAPYTQYFLIIIPLMAMIAANAIINIFAKKPALTVVVIILSAVQGHIFLLKDLKVTNKYHLQRINYVLSLTDKDDYVYDGSPTFNVFRKDIDFFWFSVKPGRALQTYQTIADYEYDIYELIERYKPKIISNHCIDNLGHPVIADNYRQSEVNLEMFIRIDDTP